MADNSIIKDTNKALNIVGIGASAGGLKAIQDLFDNMRSDTGFAFVIVQHLSPDYKSLMGELLAKHTAMPVHEAGENMEVMPDNVYLIPSKKTMRVKNGRLVLEDKKRSGIPTLSIDIFLESLAKEKGSNAIGVILSGTGTDGTIGIEAIKNAGGIVIVQDPVTAEFDGMPNSAINTGYADIILAPEMIGDELVEYINEAPLLKSFNQLNKKDELLLKDILELVNNVTGNDFSKYKLPTINRRLVKRMMEKNIRSMDDYYRLLVGDGGEVNALSKEFLINVTKFFRDEEAFSAVYRNVLPGIFNNKTDSEIIKVWSVACSSGEEAYSLAMLFYEYMERYKKQEYTVKIFATDIDQDALNTASKAFYPKSALKDMSADRIKRFFVAEGDGYTVNAVIRKMVIFAKHDITKDPPFGKIELLSCRNMLIYMNPMLQKKVLRSFHFALNEGGYLFLGPSESLGALKEHLQDVDKKWKIYKCATKAKLSANDTFFSPVTRESFTNFGAPKAKNALNHVPEIFKDTLLEEYQYAGIYIDKEMEVTQAMGNFRNFMNFPKEKFNFNLLKLVPTDLAIALGIQVRKAIQTNERAVAKKVKVHDGKDVRYITIVVKPFLSQKEYLQPFLFVILHEEMKEKAVTGNKSISVNASDAERIQLLEQELGEVRENLQAVIEEVESANEELQSSNEEIISSNEELQSTNEELQSLNEELHTVNAEHQLKIKELIELNDDLNNYFQNSYVGQLMIDDKMRIRKFSPSVTGQINLIENDIGRPVTDISVNFAHINFVNEIKTVMKTGEAIEKEIVLNNGKSFLMRIAPYVRLDGSMEGVVVNFIDVSEVKGLNEIVQGIFNSSPNGIVALKAIKTGADKIVDFEIIAANNNSMQVLDEGETNIVGKKILEEQGLHIGGYFDAFVAVVNNGVPFHGEYKNVHTGKWYEVDAIRMRNGLVATFTDTTQKKEAADTISGSFLKLKNNAEELKVMNSKLEQTNYDLLQFASVASHDLKEPLRKIQVYGNFLKDKMESEPATQENKYIEKIISASNRMQILIDDVLTLSKLSNSEFAMVPVNLDDIIGQITDDVDITIKDKCAEVKKGALGEVNGVRGQMRQLFQNLILNSLKFNNKENPEVSILRKEVTEEEAEAYGIDASKYVCIEVADNGIGFEDQFSDKIFGLFQRLNGNIYQGTGIGLSICKKIVDNHKGFISAKGKPGEGATFRILLPLAQAN